MTISRIESPIDHGQLKLPHKVACLVFDKGQILDVTGPLEVFSRAERLMRDSSILDQVAYTTEIIGQSRGFVSMSSGLKLHADYGVYDDFEADTLLIAGGVGINDVLRDDQLVERIATLAKRSERVVSICNGAFLLAETGLLNNRKATTHWDHTQAFKQRYPSVDLQIDQIYCNDGKFHSSGGVTAGIDLALSLVHTDFGQKVALGVAKQLVLYLKRPGGQNQFSNILSAQVEETSALHEVVGWIGTHYMESITVKMLADKAAMSLRNFSRRFSEETGYSPARFIERVRVEQAMRLLEDTSLSMEQVADRCGISSAEQLGQIFSRVLKVSPKFYRMRFR